MKAVTLRLEDMYHRQLKLAALEAGLTMQDFILNLLPAPDPGAFEELLKRSATPRAVSADPEPPKPQKVVAPEIISEPAPTVRQQASDAMFPKKLITCKNGHPAIRGDKCSAKGCKYSVYA